MRIAVFSIIITLLTMFGPARLGAQSYYFTSIPIWFSSQSSVTSDVTLGDVDGDGDLDLVCGNRDESNTLYENVGGTLSSAPTWTSGPVNNTRSVALGDVDGDGDLDLVCGNWGQSNTLYENIGGTLSLTPIWSSDLMNSTNSVALGDVDGDGDLDLVCGNVAGNNTLYENTGGTFSSAPVWLSSPANPSYSIALGDVDGDGDLDLVCGNNAESNTLYENTGGTFSSAPVWLSSQANATYSVAMGDVDGDGDLDLACGNYAERNTFYRNNGDMFTSTPVWSSVQENRTLSVVLADVDRDGDLDLACGNNIQNNMLYANTGAALSSTPAWLSGVLNRTLSVALGDVDGDGDLDLVCGNNTQNNTLYKNTSDVFYSTPVWSSGPENSTLSVALGDVDGDGDPDLACGNNIQNNTLYENTGGTFTATPIWYSDPTNYTCSVALGDVDGDGDPDLVCGNGEIIAQSNLLYENTGGTFSTTPIWSSGPTNYTCSVALGDVDGDGDLDLVCGNGHSTGQSNTLYENTGGTFTSTPVWSSGMMHSTHCVALGDVDGDGDLDLLCGNRGGSNTLYENTGGTFTSMPVWSSIPMKSTRSIALGDVDGDGDLDLLYGNYLESNTLYENIGGTFDPTPIWSSSPANRTLSVALSDVDGDGDLDLACGNNSESNTLYENTGGMFDSTPIWSSGPKNATYSIAQGDIDVDGDLDLVCGNYYQRNTLYENAKNPAYEGDLLVPTSHVPNNGSFISGASIVASDENHYRIIFTIYDVESDVVWIVPEYQFVGEQQWRSADLTGGKTRFGPIAAAPEGVTDSLEWDVTLLPFDHRDSVLRLRTVEIPVRVSTIQHASSYLLAIGNVVPIRPEFKSTADSLLFSQTVVTVGDTASRELIVSNTGSAALRISQIELPSVEMRVDRTTPFTLQPGERDTMSVYLEPRREFDISGFMTIETDDPVTPSYSIAVTTDIRPLDITSKLLRSADLLPLGEAATAVVTPAPHVHIERGSLHYRLSGSDSFLDSIPLALFEEEYVAVIPGEAVTEAGIEYFVRVENSGVFATDPPGAPDDSVFFQAVESPGTISTNAVPVPAEENGEITVQVFLPEGAFFGQGAVYVREGGGVSYRAISLEVGDPLPFATIPNSLVGARGVEYWVEVQTLTRTLTDPWINPSAHPHSIPVLVGDLAEAGTHTGERYRLLSIPLAMRGPILESVSDDIGAVDNTRWRMFAYDTETQAYLELPDENAGITAFEQGRGYWLITKDPHRIDTGPDRGETARTDQPYAITLRPGHNLVGTPFNFAVSWDSMAVDTIPMAEAEGVAVDPPVRWDASDGYQYDVQRFEPFEGYWVYSRSDVDVTLYIPPREADPPRAPVRAEEVASQDAWSIRLRAESADVIDAFNVAGVSPAGGCGLDRLDRIEPPPAPSGGLNLYFIACDEKRSRNLAVDMRPVHTGDPGWGEVWAFDVAKAFSKESGGDQVSIHGEGVEALPQNLKAVLIDLTLDRRVTLEGSSEYTYYLGTRRFVESEDGARFRLIVGTEGFVEGEAARLLEVPSRTALKQNIPNPFNPRTVIHYELAERGPVSLRIYDVHGSLVKVLKDRRCDPGRYEVGWNGENENGERVGSGVYFYRLRAPGYTQTRKMVLLK